MGTPRNSQKFQDIQIRKKLKTLISGNYWGFLGNLSEWFNAQLGITGNVRHSNYRIFSLIRPCLHGGRGPREGEVTRLGGVTRLSI